MNTHKESRKDKKEMKRYFNGQLTKLVDQVTSQELSIKLKELGVSAASLYFREWTGAKDEEIESWNDNESWYGTDNVNCYTVAELGEMFDSHLTIRKGNKFWYVAYWWGKNIGILRDGVSEWHEEFDTNFANALAKMLIYLIESKFI